MITERDRNRLKALIAIIRPQHSRAARIESLSDEERAQYEQWESRYHRWIEKIRAQCPDDYENPDAWLYEQTLERGRYEPKLRRDIDEALFGKPPRILKTNSDFESERKWLDEVMR